MDKSDILPIAHAKVVYINIEETLYKPNTTKTPNLIAQKAVTVWYSSTNKCFLSRLVQKET